MPPGKHARSAHRQWKREARAYLDGQLDGEPSTGTYVRPSRRECTSDPPIVEAKSDTTRFYIYIFYQGNRIVDFVMFHFVQLRPADDGWYMLARADCADGNLHVHFDDEGARRRDVTVLRQLIKVEDVEEGYDDAYRSIFDEWAEREGRFERVLRTSKRHRPTGPLPSGDFPPDFTQED